MISRQLRAIFVDFYKIILRKSEDLSKIPFFKSQRGFVFGLQITFYMCFTLSLLCIPKMFVRVSGNFWYKLDHHTTRRNDFATAERHFFRFLKIIFRVSQNPKSHVKKSFFQRPMRLGFWLVKSFLSIF